MLKGQNYNHPSKGSIIKVDPIVRVEDIQQIRELLAKSPLYYALFVVGINTNLRVSDLLALKTEWVRKIRPMEEIVIREKKTGKERRVAFNRVCVEAINWLLAAHYGLEGMFGGTIKSTKRPVPEYLFTGKRGVLTVPAVSRLVKSWCGKVGLNGNFGAHTLRKTWAFQQYAKYGVTVPILMKCLNHSSERQVLTYIGVTEESVKAVYENEL